MKKQFNGRLEQNKIESYIAKYCDPNSKVDRMLANLYITRDILYHNYPSVMPSVFYRGSSYPLLVPDINETIDVRMVEAIKHSAQQAGSGGQIQSFSGEESVAKKFARLHNGTVHTVSGNTNQFISTAQIIDKHGDRLILEGKITAGAVNACIRYLVNGRECEYFWLSTSKIPRLELDLTRFTGDCSIVENYSKSSKRKYSILQ